MAENNIDINKKMISDVYTSQQMQYKLHNCRGQGRISNIGKLGTCLGRQIYRGSTFTKKSEKFGKQPLLIYSIPI